MSAPLPPLQGWDNFYVIVGSSAAGLTGLTFVVIALVADAGAMRVSGLRTFITPIVLHFGSALWLSALLCVPGHTDLSLSICVTASGALMSPYAVATSYRMYRNRGQYRPVLEDWIWNAALPSLCYLALLAAGVGALQHPAPALYVIGGVALTLLFIGIHNAWDLAAWITVERPSVQSRQKSLNASVAAATVASPAVPPPSSAQSSAPSPLSGG